VPVGVSGLVGFGDTVAGMSRPAGTLVALLTAVLLLTACGDNTAGPSTAWSPAPAGPSSDAPGSSAAAPPSSPAAPASSAPAQPATDVKHAFPVIGKASYAREHHDYPASDIIAACGLDAVSPVDGTVLEISAKDTWTKKVNAGDTRGGLSVSILGNDGARYYMSHFRSINSGITAGATVKAGQKVAIVGDTGDAGACHVHFGLSPACAKTGDWWTRRGVIWPWPYLDAWKKGTAKSPVPELTEWQSKHGCATKAPPGA
jgi:murein DD-endopeptidase MepM/ murein hydrolase activator NlpD